MANFLIPFSNHFTEAEIRSLGIDDARLNSTEFSITLDLEKYGMTECSFLRIEHPVWQYRTTTLETAEIRDNHPEIIKLAGAHFRSLFLPVLKRKLKEKAFTRKKYSGSITGDEKRLILLRAMRPFMYPYNWFYSLLEDINSSAINKDEIQLLLEWKTTRKYNHKQFANELLTKFLADPGATLDSNPEVIPAAYLHMELDKKNPLLVQVLEKITRIHQESHQGRLRLEAVQAVWDNKWGLYQSHYEKIPLEMHDYDPVPRLFVAVANQHQEDDSEDDRGNKAEGDQQLDDPKTIREQEEMLNSALAEEDYTRAAHIRDSIRSRNARWAVTTRLFNESTYYGGIPMFILWSMRGCWEFARGEYEEALYSKRVAFHAGFQKEYVAIQMGVILNKLGRHSEVLDLFNHEILCDLCYRQTDEDVDKALTQICLALHALADPERTKAFEHDLILRAPGALWFAYQKISEQHKTEFKKQTPFERALVGCFGHHENTEN